jgi:hypothetical protein
MTETTTTPFPERMHRQSADSHTRKAQRQLKELANEITILERRIGNGTVDSDDARKAAELVAAIAGHCGAIEILRETREWDEAERNG